MFGDLPNRHEFSFPPSPCVCMHACVTLFYRVSLGGRSLKRSIRASKLPMASSGRTTLSSRLLPVNVVGWRAKTSLSPGNLDPSNPRRTKAPRPGRLGLRIRAVQDSINNNGNNSNGGPRRLVDIIRLVPEISQNYFRSPSRRALFGGISLLGGFYVAQTISLSFGALGVNDVIAAVVCVLLTEYVTRFYYSRPKVTFPLALLNNFKMGFTYGLFIDAFKLAS